MTATDDDTIPDRGDRVLMVGGQFKGQRGTMLRRNGTSAKVALHSSAHVVVQTLDGQFWAVSQERLLPLTPVQPAMRNVSMEIEF